MKNDIKKVKKENKSSVLRTLFKNVINEHKIL